MKTNILISMPNSMVNTECIENIQDIIVEYFGKKYAEPTDYACVYISDTVTKEDIEILSKKFSDKIQLTAIVGCNNTNRVEDNFIYLND